MYQECDNLRSAENRAAAGFFENCDNVTTNFAINIFFYRGDKRILFFSIGIIKNDCHIVTFIKKSL